MEEATLQLIQSRESLEFALESGRMGTWDLNLETGKIACSKEMLELWGVRIDEFNNQRSVLQKKVHPDDIEQMNAAINYAIKHRTIYELEYRIIPSPEKVLWVMARGRLTYAPGSNRPIRFAGIVCNITDRREKDLILEKALKAHNEFITIANHELKTPLTCLQLQLNVMESQLNKMSSTDSFSDQIARGLKKQQYQLQRISRIIDNALDETKISEGQFSIKCEPFDLSEMVSEVVAQMIMTAESAGVQIKLNASQKIPGNWDRFRLEQVLLNLLMNAIRYGNKKPIYVTVASKTDHALIIVRDEGIGIKAENQTRLFQRFERLNQQKVSGMGLGLFISNSIVQAHGGEIRLNSKFGKGSEFTVVIPFNSIK